jgi:hypothetical protein
MLKLKKAVQILLHQIRPQALSHEEGKADNVFGVRGEYHTTPVDCFAGSGINKAVPTFGAGNIFPYLYLDRNDLRGLPDLYIGNVDII